MHLRWASDDASLRGDWDDLDPVRSFPKNIENRQLNSALDYSELYLSADSSRHAVGSFLQDHGSTMVRCRFSGLSSPVFLHLDYRRQSIQPTIELQGLAGTLRVWTGHWGYI